MCRRYTTYKISCIITTGYIWLHVSAVTRPSSGHEGMVLLRYIQLFFQWDRSFNVNNGIQLEKLVECTLTLLFFVGLMMAG